MGPSPPPSAAHLATLLESVAGQWSNASTFAATGVHHGYRRIVVAHRGELLLPQFGDILAPFAPVREAWLSWIEPDGFIVPHIDAGPLYERWQVPLSEAGSLHHHGTTVQHRIGVPFRVNHHDWHSVSNTTTKPRISLVIDRDVVVSSGATPLRIRDMT